MPGSNSLFTARFKGNNFVTFFVLFSCLESEIILSFGLFNCGQADSAVTPTDNVIALLIVIVFLLC